MVCRRHHGFNWQNSNRRFYVKMVRGVSHEFIEGTPNEDLSSLANEAFELLIWHTIPQACLKEAVVILLSSSNNSNWRTRLSTLSYLRHFMYRWLPETVILLARFVVEPSPIKSTVTKAIADFRRTHADTWIMQKDSFTNEQLEILDETSSSFSYFA